MQDVCQSCIETFQLKIAQPCWQGLIVMVVVCPKCDVALILLEFGGVEVDYCPRCEGVWMDSGEINLLLENTGGAACSPIRAFMERPGRAETGKRPYLCPRCDRAMREVVRAGRDGAELVLDKCPMGDGVWFDKGELIETLELLPPELKADGAIILLRDVLGCYVTRENDSPGAPAGDYHDSLYNEAQKGEDDR